MIIYNDDNAGEQVVKTHRLLITLYHYHTILVCSDDREQLQKREEQQECLSTRYYMKHLIRSMRGRETLLDSGWWFDVHDWVRINPK